MAKATEALFDVEPLPPGPWDLVTQFFYLNRALFPRYPQILAPGGFLLVVHPTRKNLERYPRPSARFLLEDGELPGLVPEGLEPVLMCVETGTAATALTWRTTRFWRSAWVVLSPCSNCRVLNCGLPAVCWNGTTQVPPQEVRANESSIWKVGGACVLWRLLWQCQRG